MYIKSISIKNFLSYGEVPVIYQFDKNHMNMITATNGKGKSTIIDALTFVLYGKAFRDIKKDLLINTTNKKHTMVECSLIGNNGKNVVIKRGLKPNIFEIYEDNALVNQDAASRDYQAYLETNILGMNFIIFSQTVIISKTRYTPFMRLKTGERRSFVENILNLKIFGTMQKIQSKNLSSLKESCNETKTNIKVQNNNEVNNIDSLKRLLLLRKSASDDARESTNKEIEELLSDIDKINRIISECTESIDNTDYKEDVRLYDEYNENYMKYKSEASNIISNIKKAKQTEDTCFACGSKVDISHIESHIKEMMIDLNSCKDNVVKFKKLAEDMIPKYELYKTQQTNNAVITNEINNHKKSVQYKEQMIDKLKNKSFDSSKYDSEINDVKTKIKNVKKLIKELNEGLQNILIDIDNNELALNLLKDSGIKSSIIQDSIPSINKIICDYLYKFGFYITFELDSEFNETIYQKGVNHLIYNNFSEGEKLRIDLSLILAWREIALLKNGTSCNILFFDEIVDASMDNDGVELFAQSLLALKNTHVWIITHTPEKMENYVRGYIKLDKVDGFTVIQKNN